jgi:hypothetical protein
MWARTDKAVTAQGTRRAFGLLLALWVSLALQPCAIAASEHDCPHCPAEIAAAPTSHHDHGGSGNHHNAAKMHDCASMQADCCELDDSIVNVRVDLPDLDDLTAFITSAAPPQLADAPRGQAERLASPPEPPDRSVPIHLMKCVFLK